MSALPAETKASLPARKPARAMRLRRGDHEFLPAALEILETPLSPVRSAMIGTICAFAAAALAWAYIGQVDIIASAQGKIQPIGRTKTLQPLEPGRVLKVEVENGQSVKAGDRLVEIDSSEARADEATLRGEVRALRAEAQRRRLAIEAATRRGPASLPVAWETGTPPDVAAREERVLVGDLSQLAATVASLEAQRTQKLAERDRLLSTISAQEGLIDTLKQRLDMRMELFGRNAESKASVIDAREVYQQALTTLAGQKGQLGETQASLLLVPRDIDKSYSTFLAENAEKLALAERQVADDVEKLAKAEIKTSHMVLTSPIDGVVQGLTLTTVGQVVSSGEQIMQIVPEGAPLEIESYLPNGDIGFVEPGQHAVVKVDSFPFTDYGTLEARVTRVARDAIPQVEAEQREQNPVQSQRGTMFGGGQRTQNLMFPVTLRLDRPTIEVNGKDVPLVPGMAVTVEVKTGTRRILSYLFSPLVEVASTAMKER